MNNFLLLILTSTVAFGGLSMFIRLQNKILQWFGLALVVLGLGGLVWVFALAKSALAS
ncbi:MAG: hypothetical protein JXA13_00365 [Anaerolineales bacterium]|nr:hypothetical protein [Anaerolineales bacterium]